MLTELQRQQKSGFKSSPALIERTLATATKETGKNLGKTGGVHTLKVWNLDHIKNDTIEMKEHIIGLASSPPRTYTLQIPRTPP